MTHRLDLLRGIVLVAFSATISPSFAKGPPAGEKRQPSIWLERTAEGTGRPRFVVVGVEPAVLDHLAKTKLTRDQWTAVFSVFVDDGSKEVKNGKPAILGSYRSADGRVVFEPKYPLEPGLRYRAVFDGSLLPGQKSTASAFFVIPKSKPATPTVVEHVYPSRNRLPENQLKFYIHFSAPMSRGEAYRRVRLLDGAGKAVELSFLELDEELWDPAGKRFTLFFDPGRIKRGLKPREEVGPALEEGKSYTLVIDRDWLDAKGNPLKETYRKPFRVGAPDDEPIDPKQWKVQPPVAGTTLPLVVTFPEALDHALLNRLLSVSDSSGKSIAGTISVTDEETRWHFTPGQPWHAGGYRLLIDTTLEDLAGNQVGKPFEVDVFRQVQREMRPKQFTLNFEVKRSE